MSTQNKPISVVWLWIFCFILLRRYHQVTESAMYIDILGSQWLWRIWSQWWPIYITLALDIFQYVLCISRWVVHQLTHTNYDNVLHFRPCTSPHVIPLTLAECLWCSVRSTKVKFDSFRYLKSIITIGLINNNCQ